METNSEINNKIGQDEQVKFIIEDDDIIDEVKKYGFVWANEKFNCKTKYTKPGSISYLLYGSTPSSQSICIKMGHFGEEFSKKLISTNSNLELLVSGVQLIFDDIKKDVDLIFKNEKEKIIYYRELKANIELDTEKLPATIKKCNIIEKSLNEKYVGYTIDCGLLNWSVYNRKILTSGLSHIKTCENAGLKIEHMEDFLKIIDVNWSEDSYSSYFREIGTLIKSK